MIGVQSSANAAILPEGFVLNGTEGAAFEPNLINPHWTFAPNNELKDSASKTTIPARTRFMLLDSAGLGQIRSYAQKAPQTQVRIWGFMTSYQGRNYLFALQAVPLSVPMSEPNQPSLPTPPADANQPPVIPDAIMKMLKSQSRVDLVKISQAAPADSDFSLVGAVGFVNLKEKTFEPDGFGRNIDLSRYTLLPCMTLQKTEELLAESLGKRRFTLSGIVTVMNNTRYLLIYRAAPTFTNGNLTP